MLSTGRRWRMKRIKILAIALSVVGITLIFGGALLVKISGYSKLPDTPLVQGLLSIRYICLGIGTAITVVSVYFGNTAIHGRRKWKDFFPYLLILPAMGFLVIFVLYPILNVVYLSFFNGSVLNPTKTFEGLDNYISLFNKPAFWVAVKNTCFYTVCYVCGVIVFSLLMALWLFDDRRINKIAQTAIFTPHLIAVVSCAFIWRWILDFNDYGLINTVLGVFGIKPIGWLESSKTAMGSVIVMNIWRSVGYYTLILIAAMKSIPMEIFEAAKLDNASRTKRFFKIIFPMISPQLFVILILLTISSFNVFDSINAMTEGGPGNSTEVIARYIYLFAFENKSTLGLGSTAAVFLMLIQLALTAVYFKLLAHRIHYQ